MLSAVDFFIITILYYTLTVDIVGVRRTYIPATMQAPNDNLSSINIETLIQVYNLHCTCKIFDYILTLLPQNITYITVKMRKYTEILFFLSTIHNVYKHYTST